MKIKKKLIKISVILLLILILPLNTEAKPSYNFSKIIDGNIDIKKNLNDEITKNKKIVICSYKCSEDNKDYCESDDFSAIYYNHDNNDRSGNWLINTNLMQFLRGERSDIATKEKYSYEWDEFDNIIPYSGIYFEKSSSNKKNESWKNSSEYEELQKSFTCPKYMYFDHSLVIIEDKDNNMELCYANEKEQCMQRNETGKTTFGKANELNYSFNEELNTVLDNVILDMETESPQNIMNTYFSNENNTMCEALKYDSETFFDKLPQDNLINYVNGKLEYAVPINSINKSFYNYENISKLFRPEQSKNKDLDITYNNQKLIEKYNKIESIYINKIAESLDYYKTHCGLTDESTVESEIIVEKLEERFDNLFPQYQKIEFTELNCDNIFAELADIIKTGYFIIELIAILLVVVLTIVDYAQVILSDNQDEMKKSNKKLTTRLIIVAVILLLPALINMILKMLHIQGFNSEKPLCVEIKNK